jgi:hypothetical protein
VRNFIKNSLNLKTGIADKPKVDRYVLLPCNLARPPDPLRRASRS